MKKRLRTTKLGKAVIGGVLALAIIGTVSQVTKGNVEALEVPQQNQLIEPIRDGLSYDAEYREQYLAELGAKKQQDELNEDDEESETTSFDAPISDNTLIDTDKAKPVINKHRNLTVEATAYTATCKGCIGITKTGVDVRKATPNIIAVDPKLIPLGSKVEIFLDYKSIGVYDALDIGGDIKGNRIDILHSNVKSAYEFGRRDVKLVVIEEGNLNKKYGF